MSDTTGGAERPPGTDVERCGSCGARVTATQDWCTLCHQPLRQQTTPAAGDPAVDPGTGLGDAAAPHRTTDPLGQPVEDIAPVAGPGAVPGAGPVDPALTDAQADAVAAARADALLAELAVTSASERQGSGPLARLPRPVRLGIGCGAAVLLLVVLLAVAGLVGSLL